MSERAGRRGLFAAGVLGLAACLGGAGCDDSSAPPDMALPAVLAVDLLDNQMLAGGKPTVYRLWDGMSAVVPPLSGPQVTLKIYLSVPLSAAALMEAPLDAIVVHDADQQPTTPRSFTHDESGASQSPAAAQVLTLVPDLRSDRSYFVSFDVTRLLTVDGQRYQGPAQLSFKTARRFVVLGAVPADGAKVRAAERIRLQLSSPAAPRVSNTYDVSVRGPGGPVGFSASLMTGSRELWIDTVCPLPQGQSQVDVEMGGLEEADTLNPLSQAWHGSFTVTDDPGPCRESVDMGGMGDMAPNADM